MFNEISKYLDAVYVKDARTHKEVDCYGLCYLYNKEILEIEIPKYADFNIDQDKFKKIKIGKEYPGDIILFDIKGYPVHVGIIIQKGVMLHIMENSKPMIENYNGPKWEKRINSIWRYENNSKKTDI